MIASEYRDLRYTEFRVSCIATKIWFDTILYHDIKMCYYSFEQLSCRLARNYKTDKYMSCYVTNMDCLCLQL